MHSVQLRVGPLAEVDAGNDFATAKHARMDQEMDVEGEGMEDEECASVRGYVVSFHFHSGLL